MLPTEKQQLSNIVDEAYTVAQEIDVHFEDESLARPQNPA